MTEFALIFYPCNYISIFWRNKWIINGFDGEFSKKKKRINFGSEFIIINKFRSEISKQLLRDTSDLINYSFERKVKNYSLISSLVCFQDLLLLFFSFLIIFKPIYPSIINAVVGELAYTGWAWNSPFFVFCSNGWDVL